MGGLVFSETLRDGQRHSTWPCFSPMVEKAQVGKQLLYTDIFRPFWRLEIGIDWQETPD